MEFIKKIFIAAAIFAAFALHTDSFARVTKKAGRVKQVKQTVLPIPEPVVDADIVVNTEREKIEQAVIDTEKIKTAATLAINDANEQLAKGEISYVKAAQIIGEQNYKIDQAKQELAEMTGKSIEKVEDAQDQERYFNLLNPGVKAKAIGLLEKAGFASTKQEKAIATAIIEELNSQLKVLEKDYTEKLKAAMSDEDKQKLSQKYLIDKKEIENEIYRQQIITEEVMSTNMKLFLTAVGLAGAVVGGALGYQLYQYLGAETPGATITGELPPAELLEKKPNGSLLKVLDGAITTPDGQILVTADKLEGTRSDVVSAAPAPTPAQESTPAQELTEAPGVVEKVQNAASNIYGKVSGTIKEAAASAYEKGKELVEELQKTAETEEQYLERLRKAQERREGSVMEQWSQEPFNRRSPEEQEKFVSEQLEQYRQKEDAFARATAPYVGKFVKTAGRPARALMQGNVVPSEDLESLEISPEVLPQYREDLVQSAGEALTGAGKTIAGADLITKEDLSEVSLDPSKYQAGVDSAAEAMARGLGEAAAIQETQDLIDYELGTGGMTPAEYEEFMRKRASSVGKTAAEILEEAAEIRKAQDLPLEFGTGGREIEAQKTWEARDSYLQDLVKAEKKSQQENNLELKKLVQDKVLEWRDIDNKTSFYNPEETRALYKESREDFENKLRVATQTPEKREQIRKTQTEQQETIKRAQERKKKIKDEGTQR